MSVDDFWPGSQGEQTDEVRSVAPSDAGPLDLLPRLKPRHARLEARLADLSPEAGPGAALGWLAWPFGANPEFGAAELIPRAAGLRRVGVVVQFAWPRFATRVGVGVESSIVHAMVDRLLGHDRPHEEERLHLSPVEWGILTFVAAETLRRVAREPGPLGPWDLILDRVNPDPFDTDGLGPVVTVRWPVRVGEVLGSLRLWLPEILSSRWVAAARPEGIVTSVSRAGELDATWRAHAGTITLPRGVRTLRIGGVLPLTESALRGSPQDPRGAVELALSLTAGGRRFVIPAEPAPMSRGGRLRLTAPLRTEPIPREPLAVSSATPNPDAPSSDVPVTLVVELGRVNMTLARLADLKPGDLIELGRHSREPVELTSGGRLIARGELVQIDTELGVRITNLFL